MAQKLLLADDSVTIQRVVELTFADEDIEVISVGDGQQAVDRMALERPNIVLADVGMPRLDGYEVARSMKADPALAGIPVLLLTGAFEPVDEPRARAAGCDGVLAKPFEPQTLIARVKELLARADGTRVAPAVAPDAGREGWSPSAPPGDSKPPAGALDLVGLTDDAGRVEPNTAASPGPAGGRSAGLSLDEYFDRLDAAFANLNTSLGSPGETPEPSAAGSSRPGSRTPPAGAGTDLSDLSGWLGNRAAASEGPGTEGSGEDSGGEGHAGLPEGLWSCKGSESPVQLSQGEPDVADASARLETGADSGDLQAPDDDGSPLAEAFTAFLDEEHGQPLPRAIVEGLGRTLVVSDQLVDQVSGKVLRRLSTHVLKETVADIVSHVAERVVREEIDRLKASVR